MMVVFEVLMHRLVRRYLCSNDEKLLHHSLMEPNALMLQPMRNRKLVAVLQYASIFVCVALGWLEALWRCILRSAKHYPLTHW